MGKKSKLSRNGVNNQPDLKRKRMSFEDEPQTKRKIDQTWFPGKFVLLKQPANEENGTAESATPANKPTSNITKKKKEKKLPVTVEQSRSSGNCMNGKSKNKKKKSKQILDKHYESDLSYSENEERMDVDDGELDLESSEDDVSLDVSEEWSTDTDYSEGDSLDNDEYSFHESDCESLGESVSDDHQDAWYHENWHGNSSDDSDYVPEIEDKYIGRGEAITYDAKGLHLAFGNSFVSQIIEITDVHPAIMHQEEEVPDLINPEVNLDDISMGDGREKPQLTDPDCTTSLVQEAMSLFDNILNIKENSTDEIDIEEGLTDKINIEDDDNLESGELLKQATFYDCTSDQGVVVRLKSTIHFHGILIVRAIANNVQINGYTLQPDEFMTATSISRADYFLNLTPVGSNNYSKEKLLEKLKPLITEHCITTLIDNFNPESEAILHLQQGLPSTTVEMLKNYSTNALLPSKKMILTNSPCQTSELMLSAKFFVAGENKKVCSFELNDQWNNVEVKPSTRIVVIGGKNVGKSGLCQFLINKNIEKFKKILLIDLDIGQPIYSSSQTISATVISKPIIGPGYLSNNHPDKSFVYGDKSIMIAPFKYVRCVHQLMEFCDANPEYQNIPWLINTMGYQKGFGLQLVCLLTRILQPTDVVQVQHGIKSYNFSKIVTEKIVNELPFSFFDDDDIAGVPEEAFFTTHVLDSIVNNREDNSVSKWISNSSDKRKLSMLAQLGNLLKGNQTSLNDVTPFVAPMNKIKMVVFDEEYDQRQDFNMDLVNGNLVYLCRSDDTLPLNSNSILECYGVGIVRGIDKINGKIFLLLPQVDDVDKLQSNVNVLAIGNIPLPSEVLLKQNYSIEGNIPHVTFFKDRNASSKRFVSKRNIKDCY